MIVCLFLFLQRVYSVILEYDGISLIYTALKVVVIVASGV